MVTLTGLFIFFIILAVLNLLTKLIQCIKSIQIGLFNSKSINLKKKFGDWAVVTGSTDGIGKEYAKELAKRNINIVLISRSIDKLLKTKNEISSINSSIEVKIIQADFGKIRDEIERIDDELKDIPVGILVNNVGKMTECPMYFGEISRTDVWDMININIGAMALMTHSIIEQMKKRKKGAIVNVSSATDATPLPLMSFYAASKSLIRSFSDAIRVEYAQYGLTIQTLSPYYITTKMVGYNRLIQDHRIFFPDAATYAKHAIATLGKLDATAGYWVHDVFQFFILLVPMRIRTKCSFSATRSERQDYFKLHKKNSG